MSTEYNAGDVVMLKTLDNVLDRQGWIVNEMRNSFGTAVRILFVDDGWGSFRADDGSGYSWSLSWIKSRIGDDLIIN